MQRDKQGFTLIELMVVMAIIAVLATLVIGAVQLARRTATETTHRANAKTIQTALEGRYAKYRRYCVTTATANEIGCGTYSFADAAGDIEQGVDPAVTGDLDIKIGTSTTAGSCGTGETEAGGGHVEITDSTYKVVPYNTDCDDFLANDILET